VESSFAAAPLQTSKAQAKRKKHNPQFWSWLASLDHAIRSRQDVGWNGEADLLCGFEIDHQLEFGRQPCKVTASSRISRSYY
jgi:hypothetical protein